jgi:hypothetical protein
MRTYDPADRIRYVHLGQDPAAPQARPPAHGCHRLATGYANDLLRDRLVEGGPAGARPAFVLLAGGSAAVDASAAAAPALRLAR